MKLSEHFDLSEFTRSATADRLHIDNNLNPSDPTGQSIINNLRNLCQQVLEPLREHFGIPVIYKWSLAICIALVIVIVLSILKKFFL